MTAEVQSTPLAEGQSLFEVGDIVDGRFAIEAVDKLTPIFASYLATDHDTDGPALVVAVAGDLDETALAKAASARAVEHKNLARLIAAGNHEGRAFLAYEYHEGHTLRQLLDRKKATGGGAFTPKGALNIVTHVAAGLSALHPELIHGCVGLDTITVNKAGRVIITGAGLSAFLPGLARAGSLPDWPSIAPEVRRGAPADPTADVYSLGALVYYALVGAAPVKGCKRPSEAVSGVPAAVDTVVGKSMHSSPGQRYPSAPEVASALKQALSARPSGEQPAARPSAVHEAAAQRSKSGRPSLAQEIVSGDVADDSDDDMQVSAALQSALADNEERFLINMGNLDYGPFSLQAVVDKIRSGEIRPGHLLIDKDTGNRMPVEEQPLLADLVEQAKQRRDEERRAQAEEVHASQTKRRGFALYAFITLGVIGLGGGAYFLVSALSADDDDGGEAEVAALGDGELKVKITPIKRAKRGKRRGGKRRKGGGGGGGVAGGWDDSLNMDMSEGGGTERLDDSQINPVIQRHGGRLGGCLSRTGSRYADIDFIIAGSGKVKYVRVNGKTGGALAKCVRGAMMRMKFPSFNGPRTKANFNMSL